MCKCESWVNMNYVWILIMCEHDICVNINHGWIWFFGTMNDGWIWIMAEYDYV